MGGVGGLFVTVTEHQKYIQRNSSKTKSHGPISDLCKKNLDLLIKKSDIVNWIILLFS